jgi:hypothetical protein
MNNENVFLSFVHFNVMYCYTVDIYLNFIPFQNLNMSDMYLYIYDPCPWSFGIRHVTLVLSGGKGIFGQCMRLI